MRCSTKEALLISVAVISYNSREHYYETIDSILQQDYPYIDLILSDDASEGFCAEEVKEYVNQRKADNILSVQVYHQEENLGTVAHAEFCRKHAYGDLFYLVGAGDMLQDNTVLSRVAHVVATAPTHTHVFCGQVSNCDEELNHVFSWIEPYYVNVLKRGKQKEMFSTMSYRSMIPTTGVFYRAAFLESIGGYDTHYRLIEDAPLYLKVARFGVGVQWFSDTPIAKHRGGGICHSEVNYQKPTFRMFAEDRIRIFKREVFPYLAQISGNDLKKTLALWYKSRENYLRSHKSNIFVNAALRLRCMTGLVALRSMIKIPDHRAKGLSRTKAWLRLMKYSIMCR